MSQSGRKQPDRNAIEALDNDPKAQELGYDPYAVGVYKAEDGSLTFKHLDSKKYPDAWIRSDYWHNVDALGSREHTKR